jgi:hypothetical protein
LSIVGLFLIVVTILGGRISESVVSAHASSTEVLTTLYSQSHPHTLAVLEKKTTKNQAADRVSSSRSAIAPVPVNADRLADYIHLHQTRLENFPTPEGPSAASLRSENKTPQL